MVKDALEIPRFEVNVKAQHAVSQSPKVKIPPLPQPEIILEAKKASDIFMCNDSKALTVSNRDSTRSAQFPSTGSVSLMIAMFEYEMMLQQARASADLDRQIAEAQIASERQKAEQERHRANIAAMKLRMFQFNA